MVKTYLVAAAAVVGLALASASPALADYDNSARILKDGKCIGFVPSPKWKGPGPIIYTHQLHAVKTHGGTQSLICQFDIPYGKEPKKRATHAEGFKCFTGFGLTRDSKMIATPGGHATLICKIKRIMKKKY